MDILSKIKDFSRTAVHGLPPGIRIGKAYRRQSQFLEKSIQWSRDEIMAWQLETVKKTIRRAYEETSFYKDVLDDIGMMPEDIKSLEDIRNVPPVTKEQIRNHQKELVSNRYSQAKYRFVTTSGTTGIPLGFVYLKGHTDPIEKAFVNHAWSRFGVNSNNRNVFMRGQIVKEGAVERLGLTLILSSYHMTDSHLEEYDRAVRSFRPIFFQAYPSSLMELCKFMRRRSLPPFESLKLIVCSSENMSQQESAFIRETLRVPICDLYGNAERTVFASTCPYSNRLHFYPQYGLVEILNDDSRECTIEGECGELVTTAFTSPAFPFIRYRTGDLATFTSQTCQCGWNYHVIEGIKGRNQEYLITRDGRKIGIVAVNVHSEVFFRLRRFQFHQETQGEVTFKYVPEGGALSSEVMAEIKAEIFSKMGNDISIKLEKVDDIPRGSRGKQNVLVQEIKMT